MFPSNSSGKKVSSDIDHSIQLGARVDGAEHLLQEVAETATGEELDYRPNRSHDSRGSYYRRQNDYDWTRSPDVAPGRRFGETLAQQERRHGREAEQARHAETARAAHDADLDREASSRAVTTMETAPTDGFEADPDPRAELDRETLGRVNRASKSVSERTGVSHAAASRLVADGIAEGKSLTASVFDALDTTREAMNAPVPIAEMNPHGYEATIQGRVTHLIDEPASATQYQVAYVEDDAGTTAKVTVWAKSAHGPLVRTLREGDRVRFCGGKPGEYGGLKTLALTSTSVMVFLERGDGPAPTGDARVSFDSGAPAPERSASDSDSASDATVGGLFISMALNRLEASG